MCGRYVSPDVAAIEREWHIGRVSSNPFRRRWNAHPDSAVPFLRLIPDAGELELCEATWRYVPHWWSRPVLPKETHIARLEEAAGKPMWRDAMRANRCLMPALGWYEWAEPKTGARSAPKQPFYFHRRDRKLFCFAAVYGWWRPTKGAPLELRCALLTTAADASLSAIHERMPVVLPDTLHSAWLDPKQEDGEKAAEIARAGVSTGDFEFNAISRRINDVRNDDEGLVEPVAEDRGERPQGSLF